MIKETIKETISVSQAAEILDVNPETVRRWIKRGDVKGYRIGKRGHFRIFLEDLVNSANSESK